MTLILGLMTPEFVVLCSDRRVTHVLADNLTGAQSDKVVKTFNFAGRALAGFSGPIRIGELFVEPLVAEMLCAVPADLHWQVLRSKLDAEFRREKMPTSQFSLLGVGFSRERDDLSPSWSLVSNECDADGQVADEHVAGFFRLVQRAASPSGGIELRSIGALVDPLIKQWTEDTIRASVEDNPYDPRPAIQALIDLHRFVALTSDGWVGTAVLVTTLPRSAYDAQSMHFGAVDEAAWSSKSVGLYLPDLKGAGPPELYFPALISPGATMTGLSYKPSPSLPTFEPDGWIHAVPRPCHHP